MQSTVRKVEKSKNENKNGVDKLNKLKAESKHQKASI